MNHFSHCIWKGVRKFLNVVITPNIPINKLRIFLYRIIGYSIGENVFIGMKCYLDDFNPSNIIIEKDCIISYGVYFATHGSKLGISDAIIHLKSGCYIGTRSTIISAHKGTTIGENSVIGAMSLVNKDIPPFYVAVGIPCKPIRSIFITDFSEDSLKNK